MKLTMKVIALILCLLILTSCKHGLGPSDTDVSTVDTSEGQSLSNNEQRQ